MQPFNRFPSPAATLSALSLQSVGQPTATSARSISPVLLIELTRIFELSLMAGLGIAIAAAQGWHDMAGLARYAAISVTTAIVASALFELMGLYTVSAMQRLERQLTSVIAVWSLAIATPLAVLSLLNLGFGISRSWLTVWLVAGALALVFGRLALATATRRWASQGRLTRRAVIYGSSSPCQDLVKVLAADPNSGIRVCGIYDDRCSNRGAEHAAYPHHGGIDNLIGFARASNVDLVLLALPISAETRVMELSRRLWVLPADIRLAASASRLQLAPRACSYVGDLALIALADKPISDRGLLAKSLFDRIIGGLALIALSPVMLLIALAIKLDSRGPVLFRQQRYGFNNELVEVFKFRSMFTDLADQAAARLVTKDDARVTRVGRFIRRTSLDELPQLINVLNGTLSLVGPRPHAVSAKAGTRLYHDAIDGYFARHKVKPGITGWAQINGWRGETDTEDKLRHRVEHDLYYIENWSVWFDLEILLKTPLALLKTENAY